MHIVLIKKCLKAFLPKTESPKKKFSIARFEMLHCRVKFPSLLCCLDFKIRDIKMKKDVQHLTGNYKFLPEPEQLG